MCIPVLPLLCGDVVRRRWRWTTVCSCPTCHPRGTTCCCFIPERSSSWTWSSARRWVWWPSSVPGCPSFRWVACTAKCVRWGSRQSLMESKIVEIVGLKRVDLVFGGKKVSLSPFSNRLVVVGETFLLCFWKLHAKTSTAKCLHWHLSWSVWDKWRMAVLSPSNTIPTSPSFPPLKWTWCTVSTFIALLEGLYLFFIWMILPGSQFPLTWMIKFSTFLPPSECSPHQGLTTAQQGRALFSYSKKISPAYILSDSSFLSFRHIQQPRWPLGFNSFLL